MKKSGIIISVLALTGLLVIGALIKLEHIKYGSHIAYSAAIALFLFITFQIVRSSRKQEHTNDRHRLD